jgi:hypothetical protein
VGCEFEERWRWLQQVAGAGRIAQWQIAVITSLIRALRFPDHRDVACAYGDDLTRRLLTLWVPEEIKMMLLCEQHVKGFVFLKRAWGIMQEENRGNGGWYVFQDDSHWIKGGSLRWRTEGLTEEAPRLPADGEGRWAQSYSDWCICESFGGPHREPPYPLSGCVICFRTLGWHGPNSAVEMMPSILLIDDESGPLTPAHATLPTHLRPGFSRTLKVRVYVRLVRAYDTYVTFACTVGKLVAPIVWHEFSREEGEYAEDERVWVAVDQGVKSMVMELRETQIDPLNILHNRIEMSAYLISGDGLEVAFTQRPVATFEMTVAQFKQRGEEGAATSRSLRELALERSGTWTELSSILQVCPQCAGRTPYYRACGICGSEIGYREGLGADGPAAW